MPLYVLGVERGSITTDEEVVLNGIRYGYGLLIISNITSGSTSTYNINAFNVERMSETDTNAIVTKKSEYDLSIKREPTATTRYIFITTNAF